MGIGPSRQRWGTDAASEALTTAGLPSIVDIAAGDLDDDGKDDLIGN
jgi:hypothetical protein